MPWCKCAPSCGYGCAGVCVKLSCVRNVCDVPLASQTLYSLVHPSETVNCPMEKFAAHLESKGVEFPIANTTDFRM